MTATDDLVTSTTTTTDPATTTGAFTREIDMFVQRHAEWIAVPAHCVIGKGVALPRLHVGATTLECQDAQRGNEKDFAFHDYLLVTLPDKSFSTSTAYSLAVSLP